MFNINWDPAHVQAASNVVEAVAVVLATLFAVLEWRKAKKRQEEERRVRQEQIDREAHEIPHSYYTRYLELTVQYPELDMGDLPLPQPVTLTPTQKSQAAGLFLIWLASVQQAYLLYYKSSEDAHQRRWGGWRDYILELMARENFFEYWNMYKHQFDTEFVKYVSDLIQSN